MNTSNESITPMRLIRAFNRRWRVAALTLVVCVVAGLLACVFSPRKYVSIGMVQVAKESGDALGLGTVIGGAGSSIPEDSLSSAITLETQADILKSDALALRVIKELHLEGNHDFKPKFSLIGTVLGSLSSKAAEEPKGDVSLEDQPAKRSSLLQVFSKQLKVALVPGARLINISYANSDPKTAAAVVNALMKALDEHNTQARQQQSEKASTWVTEQMAGLRQQTELLQQQVSDMQKTSGIYSTGATDANGHPQEYSEVMDRMQKMTDQLTQAEQSRILKGAVYMAAQSGNGEILSGLAGNSVGGGLSSNTANSLSLIQSLRMQEATLESQVRQDQVKFGPAYPKLEEEKGSLTGIQNAIHDESNRLADRARTDYEIAQNTENSIRNKFEEEKSKADTLNDKAIRYMIAREEATDSRSLYEDLQKRLKGAGIAAGLGSTLISVVDAGLVPSFPKWPNVPIFMGLATLIGIFLGTLLAVILDLLDSCVKDPEELEGFGHLLGLVPEYAPARAPALYWNALRNSDSRFLDAIQHVCFGIADPRSEMPKTVMVCSALPQEGKTVLSVALANCYAQQGLNVLLMETSAKQSKLAIYASLAKVPNLSLLLADSLKAHSTEPRSSMRMREQIDTWKKDFDVIVILGPAVLQSHGSLSLCSSADHVIQVARHRKTPLAAVRRVASLLGRSKNLSFSLVMTDVDETSSEFKDYYGLPSSRQRMKGLAHDEA